jgi:hypothetical protein
MTKRILKAPLRDCHLHPQYSFDAKYREAVKRRNSILKLPRMNGVNGVKGGGI